MTTIGDKGTPAGPSVSPDQTETPVNPAGSEQALTSAGGDVPVTDVDETGRPPLTFGVSGLGLQPGGAFQLAPHRSAGALDPGALARGAHDHLRFTTRGTGSYTDLGAPAPVRPNLQATLGATGANEIRGIFSNVGTPNFTRADLDDAQAIMNGASIDAQAAIVVHAMGAAGNRYELRAGFDNRTPMETWTNPSLCRDIHTAGAQMLEAAGWKTAAVGYQDADHSHQNLLAVAPDGRVFMMEYGRLTEYPAGTDPLDALQSFNVDSPEFYFYNAPSSPDTVSNVSASVRTAMGLQVDSAVLGRGVIMQDPGVGIGTDGLGNTTVRFQATENLGLDVISMDGAADGYGVIARLQTGASSIGAGVLRFEGLRESSIGPRNITESDQTAFVLSLDSHGVAFQSALASFENGGELSFIAPYDATALLTYFPDSAELTAGMSNTRAGITPQLFYQRPDGFWASGGVNLELGKATALAVYEGASLGDIPFRSALTAAAGVDRDNWSVGGEFSYNLKDPMDERRQTSLSLFGAYDVSDALGLRSGQRVALEGAAIFETGDSAFPWVDESSVDTSLYAGARVAVGSLTGNLGVTHDLRDDTRVSIGLSATPQQWGDAISGGLSDIGRFFRGSDN
ncbi:MAG: hypothetical protein AAF654_06160 [Myxococcota bacterium]